jgi:hypothetical protein
MGFDQENRGDPFQGDYPGRPEHEQWDEHEARVQRGVAALTQRRYQPAIRHELLRLLNERRRGQPEPGASPPEHVGDFTAAVREIGFLPVQTGFDTLLAPGELLITGSSYDGRRSPDGAPGPGPSAKGYLDDIHMEASDVDCADLRGRVLRLTPSAGRAMTHQELADVASTLRARGFAASLSYVTPTGPVGKGGMAAPQPADPPAGPPQFGDGSGNPANVAIIDTGRSGQVRTDGWLQGVSGDIDPLDRFPLPSGDGYLDLAAGHGTFVERNVVHRTADHRRSGPAARGVRVSAPGGAEPAAGRRTAGARLRPGAEDTSGRLSHVRPHVGASPAPERALSLWTASARTRRFGSAPV